MIKKAIYLSIITILSVILVHLILVAPYHLYDQTLTKGVDTTFLKMGTNVQEILDPEFVNLNEHLRTVDNNLYDLIHFSHFELPIPFNNSLFTNIPKIQIQGPTPLFGASFFNGNGVELFSYQLERPYRLEFSTGKQALFELPIFNNYIQSKSINDLWEDIFTMKLSLPTNDGKSFVDSLEVLKDQEMTKLVYNLYLLYNRRELIPQDVKKVKYLKEKSIGIAEFKDEDDKILKERVYILVGNIIYPLIIKTRKVDFNALSYRARFLHYIKYRESDKDSSVAIYAKYQSFPYKKRLEQDGMFYLFSAWSHDLNNQEYLRYIIYFLERGKDNYKFLTPFYEYSFKKYGTTNSGIKSNLTEEASEKLKRRIHEDLEKELREASSNNSNIKIKNDSFTDDEEKIFYHLNQAKEKQDLDIEKRSLIMD